MRLRSHRWGTFRGRFPQHPVFREKRPVIPVQVLEGNRTRLRGGRRDRSQSSLRRPAGRQGTWPSRREKRLLPLGLRDREWTRAPAPGEEGSCGEVRGRNHRRTGLPKEGAPGRGRGPPSQSLCPVPINLLLAPPVISPAGGRRTGGLGGGP